MSSASHERVISVKTPKWTERAIRGTPLGPRLHDTGDDPHPSARPPRGACPDRRETESQRRGTNVPEAGLSSAEEALSRRAGHRGRSRPDGKLVQDVREVAVHGVVTEEEPFRDLLVRE